MTGRDTAAVSGIDRFLTWYREADFPIRAITIMWAQLLVALILPWVCYGFWSCRLPARLDVHWDGSGTAGQPTSVVLVLAIVSAIVLVAAVFSITLILCEDNNAALRAVAGVLSGFPWAMVGTFTFEMHASLGRAVADGSPAATTRPGFMLGLVAALCTALFILPLRRRQRSGEAPDGIYGGTFFRDHIFALVPFLLGLVVATVVAACGFLFSAHLGETLAVVFLVALALIVLHSYWRIEVTSKHVVAQGVGGWRRVDIPVEEISDVWVSERSIRLFPALKAESGRYVISEAGPSQVLVVQKRDGRFIRFSTPRAAELQQFLQPLVRHVQL